VGGGGASCFTARLNLPLFFFFFFHVTFHEPSNECQQTGNNLEEILDKEEDRYYCYSIRDRELKEKAF
jgi:hypothetical protein